MRMRELVEATGLPRTAIHHYGREGLLPPATKTAANAAIYGPEHVERLRLIQALRSEELGPFPLETVRQVLTLVEAGMEPEVAAALQGLPAAVAVTGEETAGSGTYTLSDLAHQAGVGLATARQMSRAGLIVGSGEAEAGRYSKSDAAAAHVVAGLIEGGVVGLGDLEPIAELIAETVRYETALVELATARLPAEEARARRYGMYRALHAIHTYLFTRLVSSPAGR